MYVKYESSITYHSKAMVNVKVFAHKQSDRRTDKRTGQKLYAPDISMRRHKYKGSKTYSFGMFWHVCTGCHDVNIRTYSAIYDVMKSYLTSE